MRNQQDILHRLDDLRALKSNLYDQITNIDIDLESMKIRELSIQYNIISRNIYMLEWVLGKE